MGTRVFIVSEDEKRRARLRQLLNHSGTDTVDRFDLAPGMIESLQPGAVVVDGVMNGKRAVACAREIQGRGGSMPLVMCMPDEMPPAIEHAVSNLENTHVVRISALEQQLPELVSLLSGQGVDTGSAHRPTNRIQPTETRSLYDRLQNPDDEVSRN